MKNTLTISAGGDPRTLPDYAALRDELSKLTHPARPDVDWLNVETRCMALFEQNGMELQTAGWYTLARAHTAGLKGMNEGLAIVEALATYQWSTLWPSSTHSRVEILSGLFQRLQKVFRTLSLTQRDDLSALYQAEKTLSAFIDTLSRLELKQAVQCEGLFRQIQLAITRLENLPLMETHGAAVVLPPEAVVASPSGQDTPAAQQPEPVVSARPHSVGEGGGAEPRVYVIQRESAAPPAPPKSLFLKPFLTGVFLTLLAGGGMLWGWHYFHRQPADTSALAASVRPLPGPLSPRQLATLRASGTVSRQADAWIASTAAQLDWLATLSPDWRYDYARRLIRQAQQLWPENVRAAALPARWQQATELSEMTQDELNGWHNGMEQLQSLSDKLNGLDERRGKYLTVSELKSIVYDMRSDFGHNIPVEEQLRLLISADNAVPTALRIKQIETRLNALAARLAQEKIKGRTPVHTRAVGYKANSQ
ncbi:VasL domain-containing protein [Erwinia sp. HR93]|uniref:VasL domain-containing protein n=1 Tax=Erwinia sp. HR93 TaxID=3094840 RepID=UPI002ADEB35C|nr:VasL domain-containing protein [Erwinia sp. HR93]MEA1064779.1 VasL domain-containing protein [Erwinia sp. HR93]